MTSPSGNLATERRLEWVRERLRQEGAVRLAEVANALDVSEMTVRRDLQQLESMGLARRVRGGAVAPSPSAFHDRHREHTRAKSRIAAKLLPMVPRSGVIGVDASSTVMRLTSLLEPQQPLTVFTNGPASFAALAAVPGVRAIITGGELDPRTGSLVGPLAVQAVGQLLLKRLFVSCAGIDAELGAGEACLEEAEVKQALARVAAEVVLAVDASKLGLRASAVGLDWSRIHVLVTELDPSDKRLDPYRDKVQLL